MRLLFLKRLSASIKTKRIKIDVKVILRYFDRKFSIIFVAIPFRLIIKSPFKKLEMATNQQ